MGRRDHRLGSLQGDTPMTTAERGEEAFGELRRIRDDVPVVIFSGYSKEDVQARFAGASQIGFVQKPYGIADLRTTLRRVLDAAEG